MKTFGFEIHITVDCETDEQLEKFNEYCAFVGAKPIVINLAKSKQVMTSKEMYTSVDKIFETAFCDAQKLRKFGFEAKRIKIEAEPRFIEATNFPYKYVEIHVPCYTDKINLLCEKSLYNWHVSKNEFKDGVTFLTYRVGSCDSVLMEIKGIDHDIAYFIDKGAVHEIFKHHYEYAIYDTHSKLDDEWFNEKIA